ncbi:unnamed protein product [Rotaria socialis]|uniref:Transposase n=1 Tax=Rotaria socialis TaxID=392032 RepID=A0A820DQ94_9BILA|nr:unnamed protein product [Rotaria socialis]
MSFQLSREQFRTMILYDWKVGLTYKDSHAGTAQTNRRPKIAANSILPPFAKEIRKQSKVWMSTSDPRSIKIHRIKSAGEKNGGYFFMKFGLIKSVSLETGAIVNASWYVNACLPQVFQAVSERRETRGLIFHDDNARRRIELGLRTNFCWKIM